ncbi:MAG TPA: hypothetical protein PKA27_00425 [Fimbriimonadaceae bacterium]|nr:hypothetical protein [Fimbriimonadaceae bacterium]
MLGVTVPGAALGLGLMSALSVPDQLPRIGLLSAFVVITCAFLDRRLMNRSAHLQVEDLSKKLWEQDKFLLVWFVGAGIGMSLPTWNHEYGWQYALSRIALAVVTYPLKRALVSNWLATIPRDSLPVLPEVVKQSPLR